MSPIERQQNFHRELKQLLLKYDAEISIDDNNIGYESYPQIVVEFKWDSQFIKDFDTGIIPDLILGRFEDGK